MALDFPPQQHSDLLASFKESSSTNAEDSPLPVSDCPPQQHRDLLAASLLAWPGNSSAARAKRAAAAYLLRCKLLRAQSSPIATAVGKELGAPNKRLGLPPFRQLLLQDDCFSVQNVEATEAWNELLPNRLLRAAAASSEKSCSTDAEDSPRSDRPPQQHSDLLAASLLAWPGNSSAARAKRAAAAYLLRCKLLRAQSSPVATAVRKELGAPNKRLGLPPFRQLLLQDDCFNVQNVEETEAWIELLPDRLLRAAAAPSEESSSTDAEDSPLPVDSDRPPQQHSDLLAASLLAWPGNSSAARAKRAAAAYLLRCKLLRAQSSPVATAVRKELGAPNKRLGLPPFRQLLLQDDCFSVQNVEETEAWIELLPDRLLRAAAAPSKESSSTDAEDSPLPVDSDRPPQQHSDLLAASLLAWPGNSSAARAKRAAAAYLLRCKLLRAQSSPVATAVRKELGAPNKRLGLPPFRQLLRQDDCFNVQNVEETEAWIELLPDRLLRAAAAPSEQSSSTAAEASPLPVTSDRPPQQHRDLLAASLLTWPVNSADARAKRAAAAYLLRCNSLCASSSRVLAAVKAELGAATQELGLPPFRQRLMLDERFRVRDVKGSEAWFELLPGRLLQAAEASAGSTASASDTGSGPLSMPSTPSPQQRSSMCAASLLAWPGNSADARAKRAAAAYLLSCDRLGANSAQVLDAVKQELGAATHELGLPPFRQRLLQDDCFSVQNALESGSWIELLPDRLLRAADASSH